MLGRTQGPLHGLDDLPVRVRQGAEVQSAELQPQRRTRHENGEQHRARRRREILPARRIHDERWGRTQQTDAETEDRGETNRRAGLGRRGDDFVSEPSRNQHHARSLLPLYLRNVQHRRTPPGVGTVVPGAGHGQEEPCGIHQRFLPEPATGEGRRMPRRDAERRAAAVAPGGAGRLLHGLLRTGPKTKSRGPPWYAAQRGGDGCGRLAPGLEGGHRRRTRRR